MELHSKWAAVLVTGYLDEGMPKPRTSTAFFHPLIHGFHYIMLRKPGQSAELPESGRPFTSTSQRRKLKIPQFCPGLCTICRYRTDVYGVE